MSATDRPDVYESNHRNEGLWQGWRCHLERKGRTVENLDFWQLDFPGAHLHWCRFVLVPISLADFPGVPPAEKLFPEATHQISVFAVNPELSDEEWEEGKVRILTPSNHQVQLALPSDAACDWVASVLAEALVEGRLIVEPQGIRGAAEMFEGAAQRWAEDARTLFADPQAALPSQPAHGQEPTQ